MENILGNLSKTSVFINFEKLTHIPRESGNEKMVSDFLFEFSKKLNLEVIREDSNNLIIKKPATKGYENSKTVILQGHMDMVCVKADDLEFDFEKDSIPIFVEGDYIKTKGTTLGADNGIALAMIMSILESNEIEHPPIIALFTVSEETGMEGVVSLNSENISGDILINLDSEEEGTLLASCAGGVDNILEHKIDKCSRKLTDAFEIKISGLIGGHSGIEINKNRANSIKLLGRVLNRLNKKIDFELFDIFGGEKMNSIAKKSGINVVVEKNEITEFKNIIREIEKEFKNEFAISDGNIKINLKECSLPEMVFTDKMTEDITNIINLIPFGINTMSEGISGLVESSVNLGIIENKLEKIKISSSIRSSVKSIKNEISERFEIIGRLTNSINYLESDYPEWEFKTLSPVRELMKDVYFNMYGKELKVSAIHAGLECGFLKEKVGDIDMISLGPNLYDVHTPLEKLSISSSERVYQFLVEVLKKLK